MNKTLTQTAGCTRRRREVGSVLVLSEDTAQAEGELSGERSGPGLLHSSSGVNKGSLSSPLLFIPTLMPTSSRERRRPLVAPRSMRQRARRWDRAPRIEVDHDRGAKGRRRRHAWCVFVWRVRRDVKGSESLLASCVGVVETAVEGFPRLESRRSESAPTQYSFPFVAPLLFHHH